MLPPSCPRVLASAVLDISSPHIRRFFFSAQKVPQGLTCPLVTLNLSSGFCFFRYSSLSTYSLRTSSSSTSCVRTSRSTSFSASSTAVPTSASNAFPSSSSLSTLPNPHLQSCSHERPPSARRAMPPRPRTAFLSSLPLPYSHRLPADRLLAGDLPCHCHFFRSRLVKNPVGFCAHASDVMNITGRAQPFQTGGNRYIQRLNRS